MSSQEEKLCASRLSIVLNVFGDICGMNTLGALEIGEENEDSEELQDDVLNGYIYILKSN